MAGNLGQAGLESAIQLLGNAFFDFGAQGAEAVSSPLLFAQGFGNKEKAEEFAQLKSQRRSSLPTLGVTPDTQRTQQDLLAPITNALMGKWDDFSEENPNASDAITQYLSDPRVMHTLGASELAVPSMARGAKALVNAPDVGRKPNSFTGRQEGNVKFGDYGHEIGRNKLNRPFDEFSRQVEDLGTQTPKKIISPESLQGSILQSTKGDRTDAGSLLTHVGGRELGSPILQEGGYGFMTDQAAKMDNAIWGSDYARAKGMNDQIAAGLEMGFDTNSLYLPMSHLATDHSSQLTKTLLQQVDDLNFGQGSINKFDEAMRKKRPDWKGINAPTERTRLENVGALRKQFVATMESAAMQKMGMPDVAMSRFANTAPELMNYSDVPQLAGGQAIGRGNGKLIRDPKVPHSAYDTLVGGEYVGQFAKPVAAKNLFSDFYNDRRAAGKPESGDNWAMELSTRTQFADQKWVDQIMKALEQE